jgi:hypothetical protein
MCSVGHISNVEAQWLTYISIADSVSSIVEAQIGAAGEGVADGYLPSSADTHWVRHSQASLCKSKIWARGCDQILTLLHAGEHRWYVVCTSADDHELIEVQQSSQHAYPHFVYSSTAPQGTPTDTALQNDHRHRGTTTRIRSSSKPESIPRP